MSYRHVHALTLKLDQTKIWFVSFTGGVTILECTPCIRLKVFSCFCAHFGAHSKGELFAKQLLDLISPIEDSRESLHMIGHCMEEHLPLFSWMCALSLTWCQQSDWLFLRDHVANQATAQLLPRRLYIAWYAPTAI